MNRKLIAALLVATLSCSMFVGCGKQSEREIVVDKDTTSEQKETTDTNNESNIDEQDDTENVDNTEGGVNAEYKDGDVVTNSINDCNIDETIVDNANSSYVVEFKGTKFGFDTISGLGRPEFSFENEDGVINYLPNDGSFLAIGITPLEDFINGDVTIESISDVLIEGLKADDRKAELRDCKDNKKYEKVSLELRYNDGKIEYLAYMHDKKADKYFSVYIRTDCEIIESGVGEKLIDSLVIK